MADDTVQWILIGTGDLVRNRVGAALAPRFGGACGGCERAAAVAKDHDATEGFDNLDTPLRNTATNDAYVAHPLIDTKGKVLQAPADNGKVTVTLGRDIQELDLPNADNVHRPLVEGFEKAADRAAGKYRLDQPTPGYHLPQPPQSPGCRDAKRVPGSGASFTRAARNDPAPVYFL